MTESLPINTSIDKYCFSVITIRRMDPLLGIFTYGIFTKWKISDTLVPYIAVISPVLAYGFFWVFSTYFNYYIGYELLIINGTITFLGMLLFTKKKSLHPTKTIIL